MLPCGPSTVVLIRDIVKDDNIPADLSPSALTTVVIDGKEHLGVHTQSPVVSVDSDRFVFSRPLDGPPAFSAKGLLASSEEADLDFVRRYFVGESTRVKHEVVAKEEGPTTPKTKLQAQFDSLLIAAKPLLARFSAERWECTKEVSFTNPHQKLAGFVQQAEGVGDQLCVELAQPWTSGLTAAKNFIARHRDYVKSNRKDSKLSSMKLSLDKLMECLKTVAGVRPAATLTLLWLKINFDDKLNPEASNVSDATKGLIADGVADAIAHLQEARVHAEVTVSSDFWLRTILMKAVHRHLSSLSAQEEWEAVISQHAADLTSAMGHLRAVPIIAAECADCLKDIGEYLKLLSVVTSPAASNASAKELQEALTHIENAPRMRVLKEQLFSGNACARNIVSTVSALLQVSAKDEVGDEKAKHAVHLLKDNNLPFMSIGKDEAEGGAMDGDATISNFHAISDMTAVDVLEESLSNMAEAASLWTSPSCSHRVAIVKEWCDLLSSTMRFFDECLCLFVQGVVSHGLARVCEADTEDVQRYFDLGRLSAADTVIVFSEVVTFLDKYGIDEAPLMQHLAKVNDFLKGFEVGLKEQLDFRDSKESIARVMQNIRTREKLLAVYEAIGSLGDIPESAKVAITDWKAKQVTHGNNATFISRGTELIAALSNLGNSSFALSREEDVEITIVLQEEGGAISLSGEFKKARDMPETIAGLGLVGLVRSVLRKCAQAAFDDFVDGLNLAALKRDGSLVVNASEDLAPHVALDACLDKTQMGEAVKTAAKIFASNPSSKHYPWPQQASCCLVYSLLEAVPDENFAIDLSRLCVGTEPGVAMCKSKDDTRNVCAV